ncbi:MAG: hypothetical protein F6J94_30630 [Moorea sp. SIO1F2]|uniref:hypothetical protein n=1 Tax=unclassified Moorena TaxID=2683338 RepID=UPI0013BAA8ED|nr:MULTISPECIES: hypothetical protein [unclassified Moorena]NEN97406.1 hypothetical protein [Moorena sp. SIO3I7]NEO10159.1 hypothetical protein [Moorena sp. SIO3I8]NEO21315.1 hypothetical protein [Moorena sp. SIO4A5]NEP26461.1 hypothetical protein [Moorena sp. SIO3I6]NEQ62152.1 hypothetical protein [Moorena sp. SIO4A1]
MPVPRLMPIPPTCPFQKTLKIIPLLSNAGFSPSSLFPAPCSRLDAVAHGGNPQDRAASLLPKTQNFVPHRIDSCYI